MKTNADELAIRDIVLKAGKGTVFKTSTFIDLFKSSDKSKRLLSVRVSKAFTILMKEGIVSRIERGTYVIPDKENIENFLYGKPKPIIDLDIELSFSNRVKKIIDGLIRDKIDFLATDLYKMIDKDLSKGKKNLIHPIIKDFIDNGKLQKIGSGKLTYYIVVRLYTDLYSFL